MVVEMTAILNGMLIWGILIGTLGCRGLRLSFTRTSFPNLEGGEGGNQQVACTCRC